MARLLKFFGFWSLLVFAGLVAVASITFAATLLQSERLVVGILVVGSACVVPVSLAVASSRFYPARPASRTSAACPHCGGQLAAHDPKPVFELWPYV